MSGGGHCVSGGVHCVSGGGHCVSGGVHCVYFLVVYALNDSCAWVLISNSI